MPESNVIGVALTKCYYCGEDADILINRTLTQGWANLVRLAHGCVIDMRPCSKCEERMKEGVIVIVIDEKKTPPGWNIPPTNEEERKRWMPDPHRVAFAVVKDRMIRDLVTPPELASQVLLSRWTFMDSEGARKAGILDAIEEKQTERASAVETKPNDSTSN